MNTQEQIEVVYPNIKYAVRAFNNLQTKNDSLQYQCPLSYSTGNMAAEVESTFQRLDDIKHGLSGLFKQTQLALELAGIEFAEADSSAAGLMNQI
jgi:hypothetical protein